MAFSCLFTVIFNAIMAYLRMGVGNLRQTEDFLLETFVDSESKKYICTPF